MIGLPGWSGSRAETAFRSEDQLREMPAGHGVRWHAVLVWFMRALAGAWFVKGLLAWALILGLTNSPQPFEGAPSGFQAAVIYFAVLDLAAAVGLWLAANWGGVLWLMAVMSHLILASFFPRSLSNSTLVVSLMIFGLMVYLTMSWLASAEEH